jgi:glycosyltransferase 2 family protein
MKKTINTTLKLLVTAGVMWYIIDKLGWQAVVETVTHARVKWLAATGAVFLISNCFGAYQWMILLKNKGIDLSYSKSSRLYFIGMFFSNFIFGMAAADAVRITYLKLDKSSGKAGFAATFLDRFAGLIAMLAFAVAGSVLLLKQKAIESRSLDIALIALLVTFGLLVGLFCLIVSSRFQKMFFFLISKSFLPAALKQGVTTLTAEVILEAHDRHVILPVAALSTVIQLLRIGGNITCAAALGLLTPANVHYFFIFVPMLAMLMIIPLPFGVREGIGGTLFMLAGFAPRAAFIMGFLTSIVGIIVSLPGGFFFIVKPRSKAAHEIVNSRSVA